jgi:glutathione S-transferase
MKLYTSPFSSNARKAEMAIHMLGLEVERVNVNLGTGEQRKPEYLAVNPAGRVPALVDGDFALPESNAIMMYLCDKTPGNTLFPTEPHARYDVLRWLFWQASHWSPVCGALNFENMLKKLFGGGEPDPVQVKRQEDLFRQFAGYLDAHLAKHEWVSGKHVTLADIAIAPSLMYIQVAKLPVDGFSHVLAWFDRIRALDAWKKTEPPPFPR